MLTLVRSTHPIDRHCFLFILVFPAVPLRCSVFFLPALFPFRLEGSLKEQLERLPVICRFQYTAVAEFVLNIVDPVLASYQSAVAQFPQSNGAVSWDYFLRANASFHTSGTDHVSLLGYLHISGKICMVYSSCYPVGAVRSA